MRAAAANEMLKTSRWIEVTMGESTSLKRTVLSAIRWATFTRLAGQLANWAMTLLTIRFLQPGEYGLMAMTMVIAGFLQSLSYVGIADAVVQSRRLDDDQLRSVFGIVLLINAACILLLCLLAYPAAWFYDEPQLVLMLQVSSLMFIAMAFQAIPRAILEKRLDLKTVSRIELVANVLSGSLVLALAWVGAGVWALLAGMLLAAFLRMVGFLYALPYFQRPRIVLHDIADILRAGGLRTGEQLLWFIYSNADVFILGKILGPYFLGVYTVARHLAALPVEKLAVVIKPVAFPAFSRVQEDRDESVRYLIKAMRLLGFLSFPVLVGIAAVSPQIVTVVLGPRWAEAALPLAILAMAMSLRPVGFIIPSFLMGIGEFSASFKNTLIATILFPIAFIIGCYWGMLGVCVAWLVAYPVQLMSLLRRVSIVTGVALVTLINPLLSPLAGALLMYVVVRLLDAALSDSLPQLILLGGLIVGGAVVYFGYAIVFLRPVIEEFLLLVRPSKQA